MGPTRSPGDKLIVLASGPFTTYQANDPTLGPPETRVLTGDGTTVGYLGIEDVGFGGNGVGSGMVAVATDAGPETQVQVYDRLTGALRYQITPFAGFNGGASVASGDVNGDGIADLIVGAGPGGGPRVMALSGAALRDQGVGPALNSPLLNFFGGNQDNRGGIRVVAKDLDGDGRADIITGDGTGGQVSAYDHAGGQKFHFDAGDDQEATRGVYVG